MNNTYNLLFPEDGVILPIYGITYKSFFNNDCKEGVQFKQLCVILFSLGFL
jgi:hypothetical protein